MAIPKRNRRGWWKVRDAHGEIKVRPWSNGIWWTPLKGGWISAPPGYVKLKFLCGMEPHTSDMDPIDEMKRAEGMLGKRSALRR
jgi:hypothetical protein